MRNKRNNSQYVQARPAPHSAIDPRFERYVRDAVEAAQTGAVSGLDFVGGAQYPGEGGWYPGAGVNGVDIVGEAARAAALQVIRAQQAPMAPPGVYDMSDRTIVPRRKIIGFPLTTIAANALAPAVQPNTLPQEALRPERLVIEDITTGSVFDLLVNDIRVGAKSQNVGTGPIPASAFASIAFDTLFGGNTLNPGIVVQLNISLNAPAQAARVFAISIIGVSVDVN